MKRLRTSNELTKGSAKVIQGRNNYHVSFPNSMRGSVIGKHTGLISQ